jgi:hypothetical protein
MILASDVFSKIEAILGVLLQADPIQILSPETIEPGCEVGWFIEGRSFPGKRIKLLARLGFTHYDPPTILFVWVGGEEFPILLH